MTTNEQVLQALQGVIDPELKRSLVELGMIRDVKVQDGQVGFTLALTTLDCPLKDQILSEARQAVLGGWTKVIWPQNPFTPACTKGRPLLTAYSFKV